MSLPLTENGIFDDVKYFQYIHMNKYYRPRYTWICWAPQTKWTK